LPLIHTIRTMGAKKSTQFDCKDTNVVLSLVTFYVIKTYFDAICVEVEDDLI
jgi:hypothetical protein